MGGTEFVAGWTEPYVLEVLTKLHPEFFSCLQPNFILNFVYVWAKLWAEFLYRLVARFQAECLYLFVTRFNFFKVCCFKVLAAPCIASVIVE